MNEVFFSDALSTIIKMTLTGSIVTLLLLFFKPIIKNRLPKTFQYYTWLIVISAFMIPFSKYIILPIETTSLPISTIAETVESVVAQESDNLQEPTIQTSDDKIQVPEAKTSTLTGVFSKLTLLVIIWSLGVFIFLSINLIGYFSFTWKMLQGNSPARNEETSMLATLHKRPPVLYRNKLAPTPMLIGVIRPIIILPDKEYTSNQLKNILLHELIHFRRKDIFLKWIMIVANAIHWFNPFIYLVRRELNHMCELACDEGVIKDLTVYEKQEYGNTLISVVAEKRLPNAVLSTTMSEEKKALKERLGAIMNNKNTTRKALIISVLLFAIILCTTILIGASKSSKISPSKWDDLPDDSTISESNPIPLDKSELEMTHLQKIEEINKQIATQEVLLTQLGKYKKENQDEIEEIENKIAELKVQIAQLEKTIVAEKETMQEEDTLEITEFTIEQMEKLKKDRSDAIEQIESQIAEQEEKISQLEKAFIEEKKALHQ